MLKKKMEFCLNDGQIVDIPEWIEKESLFVQNARMFQNEGKVILQEIDTQTWGLIVSQKSETWADMMSQLRSVDFLGMESTKKKWMKKIVHKWQVEKPVVQVNEEVLKNDFPCLF